MEEKKTIRFTKMHGAGNDYIYVDAARYSIGNPAEAARLWSRSHTGIGSDGLILVMPSSKADFRMRMFNSDGSEGAMCGNGARCLAKFVHDHALSTSQKFTLETLAGIRTLQLHMTPNGSVNCVTVDMGQPAMSDSRLFKGTALAAGPDTEVTVEGKSYRGTFVSMGNPHFVIFVNDINSIDLAKEGKALENLPLFPQGCNIEFACMLADNHIRTRVWERGSGITQACGTGACATLVAAVATERCGHRASIVMDGGTLITEWNRTDHHIYLTGEAVTVYEGEINYSPEITGDMSY